MHRITAERFINVYEKFKGKLDNLSNLKPSIIYELASATDEVINQAIEKVEAGESGTFKEVQEWKRRAKEVEYELIEARQASLLSNEAYNKL